MRGPYCGANKRGKSHWEGDATVNRAVTAGAETDARHCPRSATAGDQVSGGARDWNGARRDATRKNATRSKWEVGRGANSAGNCGACGRKELATR